MSWLNPRSTKDEDKLSMQRSSFWIWQYETHAYPALLETDGYSMSDIAFINLRKLRCRRNNLLSELERINCELSRINDSIKQIESY